jgi:hypothetical protein
MQKRARLASRRGTSKVVFIKRPAQPRSLQFSLEQLSSTETSYLLMTLGNIHQELCQINSTFNNTIPIRPVFGWRSSIWETPAACGDGMVICKSAKAFEDVDKLLLTQKLWESTASVVSCAINEHARVVQQFDATFGREQAESFWLEYLVEQGHYSCIMRRQLPSFRGYRSSHSKELECQGYVPLASDRRD